MRVEKGVHGTQDVVNEWEFGSDTVYHRTNIKKVVEKDMEGRERAFWLYDEEQMSNAEYMSYSQKEMSKLKLENENLKQVSDEQDLIISELLML